MGSAILHACNQDDHPKNEAPLKKAKSVKFTEPTRLETESQLIDDNVLFKELELALGLHNFYFEDIA